MCKRYWIALALGAVFLASCVPVTGPVLPVTETSEPQATTGGLDVTPVAAATEPVPTPQALPGQEPTSTGEPRAAAGQAATPAVIVGSAAATPAVSVSATDGTPRASAPAYLDDRSSPQALLDSYANALSQHEYTRAYSYWETPPAAFDAWRQGFADTTSARFSYGQVSTGAGAGQVYYTVPAVLVAGTREGQTQTFAGCYILHLSNPAIQATPPFHSLAIQRANLREVTGAEEPAALLATACQGQPQGIPAPLPWQGDPADITAQRYLDDRSDGVQVLRSLFNAINRKEYARAYSYWQATPGMEGGPPPFAAFQAGYAQTQAVTLATGEAREGVAAGNIYWNVPVTLTATTDDGVQQRFAGCYRVHLANPSMQEVLPFVPAGIDWAQVRQLANGSDAARAMAEACP